MFIYLFIFFPPILYTFYKARISCSFANHFDSRSRFNCSLFALRWYFFVFSVQHWFLSTFYLFQKMYTYTLKCFSFFLTCMATVKVHELIMHDLYFFLHPLIFHGIRFQSNSFLCSHLIELFPILAVFKVIWTSAHFVCLSLSTSSPLNSDYPVVMLSSHFVPSFLIMIFILYNFLQNHHYLPANHSILFFLFSLLSNICFFVASFPLANTVIGLDGSPACTLFDTSLMFVLKCYFCLTIDHSIVTCCCNNTLVMSPIRHLGPLTR